MPIARITMRSRFARMREEKLAYVRSGIEVQRKKLRLREKLAVIDRHVAAGEPVPPELRDEHLTRAFERAGALYRPKPWSGPATLFRAEEVEYIYRDAGPSYGWESIVRGALEVVRIPGNHWNLLLEPNASILVRALSAKLESIADSRRRARAATAG